MVDSLRETLDSHGLGGNAREDSAAKVSAKLRSIFYSSTTGQRTLLQRIARSYAIAFALRAEPRVLSYFDDMMDKTWLFVGSDVLIVALSERYLPENDRHTRNLLQVTSAAGARLILTAPVLDEVLAHVRGTDRDYLEQGEYLEVLNDYELVRNVPRILLRAYLYSRDSTRSDRPRSWEQFVHQFCDYGTLHKDAAETDLKRYLMTTFSMRFENWQKVLEVCDKERHAALTKSLLAIKDSGTQADIDAYVYDLVQQTRMNRQEDARAVEFGYQTWWLSSGEGAAVRAMSSVDGRSERILMRPGFLAKYIQFSPSASKAREDLHDFLPSLLGIRLGRRVTEEAFTNLMDTLRDAESLEPGGRAAKMAAFADRLKESRRHEYEKSFDAASDSLMLDMEG